MTYGAITAQQARRWALFARQPNEWALENVIGRPEPYIVGTTGRQVGKTDELADRIDTAMSTPPRESDLKRDRPPECGILGPNYEKALMSVERYIERITKVFGQSAYRLNQNKHELVILDPLAGIVGAKLKWLSAEEEYNVVGHTLSWFGIDEAQAISDNVYYKFMPTMDVRDAHGVIFGTPDTTVDQTWFQGLYDAGQDPLDTNVHSFTTSSWDAPWMTMARILAAKAGMPDEEFRRLYGGEWVEGAGLVFTRYEGAMLATPPEIPVGRRMVMAVDIAIHKDFTVAMIGDPATRTAVYVERWNDTDPLVTYDRLLEIWERFGKPQVWFDATGMGAIPARELKGQGMRVHGTEFGLHNKMDLVQKLSGDLQHRRTMFPASWTDLTREMKSFIYGRSPTGKRTAQARAGAHDDLVMTFVLLNQAFNARGGGSLMGGNWVTGGNVLERMGLRSGMFNGR